MFQGSAFAPAPQHLPARHSGNFNLGAAAVAALPVVMLSSEAEAAYGVEMKRWNAILMPLMTLVLGGVLMATFTLYVHREEAFFQLRPKNAWGKYITDAWRAHPVFANIKDPFNGMSDMDDFNRGLEAAWDKSKPAGSKITVKDKLKELSEQSNPHSHTHMDEGWVREFPGLKDKVLEPA